MKISSLLPQLLAWKWRYPLYSHNYLLESEGILFAPTELLAVWDKSSPATPCHAVLASFHFLTYFYNLLATIKTMFAVVYTCCPAWITLLTQKLWLVTRCMMLGRITLYWGTDSIQSFFQGSKVLLYCFQCWHQHIWLWLGVPFLTLGCFTWAWLALVTWRWSSFNLVSPCPFPVSHPILFSGVLCLPT